MKHTNLNNREQRRFTQQLHR